MMWRDKKLKMLEAFFLKKKKERSQKFYKSEIKMRASKLAKKV
jgi:hypothetical protein